MERKNEKIGISFRRQKKTIILTFGVATLLFIITSQYTNCTDMQIYGHSYDDVMKQFLASAPRYRLVAIPTRPEINEPKALNVGRELAAAINALDRGSKTRFQFEVQDALMRIIHEHTFIDPVFGDCLIIDNPGILYEASLGVNVTNLLKSISKNTMTILLWPGEITPQKLFFLDRSSHYYIKQSDINYIII